MRKFWIAGALGVVVVSAGMSEARIGDRLRERRAERVSSAHVTVLRAARLVGQGAVQLHGGMGMTDELAVGHGFKRLTVMEQQFGGVAQHLRRVAGLTRA